LGDFAYFIPVTSRTPSARLAVLLVWHEGIPSAAGAQIIAKTYAHSKFWKFLPGKCFGPHPSHIDSSQRTDMSRGPPRMRANVRFWHKADMLNALTNVRFWGQTGHLTNRWLLTNLDL